MTAEKTVLPGVLSSLSILHRVVIDGEPTKQQRSGGLFTGFEHHVTAVI